MEVAAIAICYGNLVTVTAMQPDNTHSGIL